MIKITIIIFISSFLIACNGVSTRASNQDDNSDQNYPESTKSFSQAKREATKIYINHQEAFYSGCGYYALQKKLIPLKEACGYITRKDENRASRIEWEHIVSMWQIGHQLQCWQNGGRSNCSKNNNKFKIMETDLHNLVPTIGEINNDRSNHQHGMIEGEERRYGETIDVEVDFKAGVFEPRPAIRGDIARIYFYMQQKYGLTYSNQQIQPFNAWAISDPISAWEKERNLAITAIQGDSNHVVSEDDDYPPSLSCDPAKKYCRHMTSCAGATYYLNSCGRTRLDGDKDGVPCESLCR